MKPYHKLDKDIFDNEYSYFFTLLTDRFMPLNTAWQEALEKRFDRPFKPISILAARHNSDFDEDNQIVLEDQDSLSVLRERLNEDNVFDLVYPEDLNRRFSESSFIDSLIDQLIDKQGTVFVLSFTSVWLNLDKSNVTILGPNPDVASMYDAKTEHYKVFEKLGYKTVDWHIYSDINDILANNISYPFYISAKWSSGGIESRAVSSKNDLLVFYEGLREVNQKSPLIYTELITGITSSPNSTAIVCGENDTRMMCISDQLLRRNKYMGNVYPADIPVSAKEYIEKATIGVGNYLAGQGFRGLFGIDFLITKSGRCLPVDLNPRRQGGYYCIAMSSPINVIDLELAVILGDAIPHFSYEDFRAGYAWAHSKLSPYKPDVRILESINSGNPLKPFQNIGSVYKAVYYPAGYILHLGNPGFYMITGNSRQKIIDQLTADTANIISNLYE